MRHLRFPFSTMGRSIRLKRDPFCLENRSAWPDTFVAVVSKFFCLVLGHHPHCSYQHILKCITYIKLFKVWKIVLTVSIPAHQSSTRLFYSVPRVCHKQTLDKVLKPFDVSGAMPVPFVIFENEQGDIICRKWDECQRKWSLISWCALLVLLAGVGCFHYLFKEDHVMFLDIYEVQGNLFFS